MARAMNAILHGPVSQHMTHAGTSHVRPFLSHHVRPFLSHHVRPFVSIASPTPLIHHFWSANTHIAHIYYYQGRKYVLCVAVVMDRDSYRQRRICCVQPKLCVVD